MIKRINKLKTIVSKELYHKLFRYVLVGGCTTFVSFGVYWLLYDLFKINPTISNTISVFCAVIFAYITNKIFVFKSKCTTLQELIMEIFSFFSSRMITMLVEIGGVFFLFTYLKVGPMASKIIVNGIVLILNYLLSQFIVFRNT